MAGGYKDVRKHDSRQASENHLCSNARVSDELHPIRFASDHPFIVLPIDCVTQSRKFQGGARFHICLVLQCSFNIM